MQSGPIFWGLVMPTTGKLGDQWADDLQGFRTKKATRGSRARSTSLLLTDNLAGIPPVFGLYWVWTKA